MGSHRVSHNWSDLACMHALEKEMATHSSILAWRIPGTGEPGGLPSMGSHRAGHNWNDLAAVAAAACIHALEKEMAMHSSILAWRIPGTEEPGGLPFMGSHRAGHNWNDLAAVAAAACMHALEKEMAMHSSILAWRIPGTEEPGGLPSMGSHRVRHDWSDLAAVAAWSRHYRKHLKIFTLYNRKEVAMWIYRATLVF